MGEGTWQSPPQVRLPPFLSCSFLLSKHSGWGIHLEGLKESISLGCHLSRV